MNGSVHNDHAITKKEEKKKRNEAKRNLEKDRRVEHVNSLPMIQTWCKPGKLLIVGFNAVVCSDWAPLETM